ncbi:hypothetical protein ILYODFUR_007790 [Ilyodon furcidens]|uniref:Uncharacterized protein n=1 Tax=Ilyodon furcidens TaxID=33524 RepID=A0ABV0VEU3_9TELE
MKSTGELIGGTMRQPQKQEWFCKWIPKIFFSLFLFDWFSVVLHLIRVSLTTGSMRQFLDPMEVVQAVQLHQDHHINTCHCPKICCVSHHSQECGGDARRQVVSLGELDRVIRVP